MFWHLYCCFKDLMELNRINTPEMDKQNQPETEEGYLLSMFTSGLYFDFHPTVSCSRICRRNCRIICHLYFSQRLLVSTGRQHLLDLYLGGKHPKAFLLPKLWPSGKLQETFCKFSTLKTTVSSWEESSKTRSNYCFFFFFLLPMFLVYRHSVTLSVGVKKFE